MIEKWKKGGIAVALFALIAVGLFFVRFTGYVNQSEEQGFVFSIQTPSNNTTNITTCNEINLSGYYLLNSSISDLGVNESCINISSDDVVIDCQGFAIENTSYAGYAIFSSGRDNITIFNCSFNYANNSTNIFIENSTNVDILSCLFSKSKYGINISSTSGLRIANSSFYNIYESAVLIKNSSALLLKIALFLEI